MSYMNTLLHDVHWTHPPPQKSGRRREDFARGAHLACSGPRHSQWEPKILCAHSKWFYGQYRASCPRGYCRLRSAATNPLRRGAEQEQKADLHWYQGGCFRFDYDSLEERGEVQPLYCVRCWTVSMGWKLGTYVNKIGGICKWLLPRVLIIFVFTVKRSTFVFNCRNRNISQCRNSNNKFMGENKMTAKPKQKWLLS